jgi:hypothetical protein
MSRARTLLAMRSVRDDMVKASYHYFIVCYNPENGGIIGIEIAPSLS